MDQTANPNGAPAGPCPLPDLTRAVESVRHRLLDVGKRNKLINAPIGRERAKQLTIEDELSDEVFKILYLQGKSMTFQPAKDDMPVYSEHEDDESVFLPTFDVGADPTVAERHSDKKLQTRLAADGLQKKSLTLFRDAQTLEEEQGISVLFLALGFLSWFESESSEIERFAPLILLPVDLVRDSARGRFRLVLRDEDLDPNLSLRAMLTGDFGLTLPNFPEEGEWLPTEYFSRVQSSVSSQPRWRVRPNTIELSFFSFAKFLMWKDLDPDVLKENDGGNVLLGRVLVGGFEREPGIFAPDENLDMRFSNPRDLGHILDADTSQTQVIAAARGGRNLVVQGPPGTGKSQTIANMIAGAAADGKTVLFIAEKRAALDVVHDRIEECGLGPLCLELHSHKASRRHIYGELRRTLELGEPTAVNETHYARVRTVRDELNEMSALLHRVDEVSGETPYVVIGKIAELDEAGYSRADFRIPGADSWDDDDFGKRADAVKVLADLTSKHGSEREHVWRGTRKRLNQLDRRSLAELLQIGVLRLDKARSSLREAAESAGVACGESAAATVDVAEHLDALNAMPGTVPALLNAEIVLEHPALVLGLIEAVAASQALRKRLVTEVAEDALDLEWSDVRMEIARRGRSWFRWLSGSYRTAVGRLRSFYRRELPRQMDGRLATLDGLIEYRRLIQKIARDTHLGRGVFGVAWQEAETDIGGSLDASRWVALRADKLESGSAVKRQVESVPHGLDAGKMAVNLRQTSAEWTDVWNRIEEILDLDVDVAFGVGRIEDVDFAAIRSRIASWNSQSQTMEGWHRLYAAARAVSDLGLDEIRNRVADGRLSNTDASAMLIFVRAESIWDRMRSEEPRLESIDGEERSRKIEEFKNLDQQLQGLASQEVALWHFNSLPAGSAGQIGIVRGEVAKKTRHMRIRQLLERAGEAVQAIKPVFLMSPLSVAQYLKPGGLTFDLLLIDEASQVPPADALGAMMRCRQVVVVGDQKQLPPTSFFDRQTGSDEDDLDSDDIEEIKAGQVGDMESILSLCESRAMTGGMLRWHYRSRHPSLIAVSNHEFYDNTLVCPPSPDRAGSDSGLSLVHVKGAYDRGRKRDNPREAQVVAEQVLDHAREHPDETLGVVALSVAQRDTIRNTLEFMRAEYPELDAFCKEGRSDAFFVKNLENVQGDERDVIFISIGYGKDADGYLAQNFGPVSSEGGERRLNVLFTRARTRCRVFSAIKHSDIRVDATKRAGARVLKRYLKYAETGELDIPVIGDGAMESPFEEAVAQALQNHGYRVAAQVGSSRFRIDLAVYDPDDEGRFLLAVECDGARYHSSSWARERDRLRQIVLEQKGWTFHRIWSTDWFYDRETELRKLLEAIERARVHNDVAYVDENLSAGTEVERLEPTAPTAQKGDPYVEADFPIQGIDAVELHEAAIRVLAECVTLVVETEGPIHVEEVGRRLSRLWGYQRAGSRIQSRVKSAADSAVRLKRIRRPDGDAPGFLDVCDRTGEVPIRDRSDVRSQTLRNVEMISLLEIKEGILSSVNRNIGINPVECAKEVSIVLGYKSLRADLRNRIRMVAGKMVERGDLQMSGEELRIPEVRAGTSHRGK